MIRRVGTFKIGFRDFCYCYFNRLGRVLSHTFNVEKDLEVANMNVHPEVYFSILSFISLVSLAVPASFFLAFLFLGVLGWINPLFWLILASPPLIVILAGVLAPKMAASNRISGLQIEVPYASMYLSVMVSGGLSPYACLLRLRHTDLLPKMREEIKRIQSLLLSSGSDPVSVIEKIVKNVGIKEYKDLFLGYASTIKTGGDVAHYIYTQTESMFRGFATRIKGVGEIIGTLMEGYMIVGVLGTLGLYMIFIISISAPMGGAGGFSQESFFMFAFIVIPIVSGVFMYLGDLFHIKYPSSNQKAYLVLAASAPPAIFLATQMFLPAFYHDCLIFPQLETLVRNLRSQLGFAEGCEAALGLAISLAVLSVPVAIADYFYSKEEKGVLNGITTFLRDMTENRKTGLSPEKCIRILSRKEYGRLSRYLRRANAQMNWGFPMSMILADFRRGVRNWLAQINMYLLIDTIVVGGGNEESFETLAEFAETSAALEKERKTMLTPLLIIPIIGAVLLVVTATMFLNFFSSMSGMLQPLVPIVTLRQILVTPLILHDFLLGLVTGKIVSGRVSSGFKIGGFLVLLAIAGIWLSPLMTGLIEFAS